MKEFHLKRGINMESPGRVLGDALVTCEYLQIVKDAGFDHVRFPVNGQALLEQGPALWDKARTACEAALSVGLTPILDMHGFPGMTTEPHENKAAYLDLWERLAKHLSGMDERVVFEMFNEPSNNYTFKILNEVQNEAIERIRKSNPTRLLAAATAHYNTIENLQHLRLPEDDPNIFVTLHDYTPMHLTHQNAPWEKVKSYPETAMWGTPEERDYLRARIDFAYTWGKLNNRHLHLGEFGVVKTAPMSERVKWTAHMIRLCEERNIGWCIWEFWNNFYVYDREKQAWDKELLGAVIQS